MQTDHYQNVVTLLEQYVKMQNQKKELEHQIQKMADETDYTDEIEKLEEEHAFVTSYSRTLLDQATVIINENNVKNVPSIETLSKKLLV